MVAPTKLAHLVFRTNQLQRMVDWYGVVLEAKPTYQDHGIAFLTYDDEHHRVAFVALEPYAEKPKEKQVGFYHVAFTYGNLGELLDTYERLKALNIEPWRPILHGPTVSFYFKDPDDNDVELQVDAFPDLETATAWMQGPAFARDPIGVIFNPEEMIAKYRSGVPEAELMRRPDG
jgi:catechol-2,3-dioxygenase